MILEMIQSIINGTGGLIESVLNILPVSPFRSANAMTIDNQMLALLSWIVPFPEIISLLELWIAAVAVYYVVMVQLRLSKVIE